MHSFDSEIDEYPIEHVQAIASGYCEGEDPWSPKNDRWRAEHFLRADMPGRYRDAQLEQMDARLAALPVTSNLYICGPTGSGKTHQAWLWILRCVTETEPWPYTPPQFYSASDLLNRKGASYKRGAAAFDTDRGRLLVLDDLGAERSSDWSMDLLFDEVNARYNRADPTAPLVVTSNYTPGELRERMDDRIVSRLIEMCGKQGVIRIEGDDRRLQLALDEEGAA